MWVSHNIRSEVRSPFELVFAIAPTAEGIWQCVRRLRPMAEGARKNPRGNTRHTIDAAFTICSLDEAPSSIRAPEREN